MKKNLIVLLIILLGAAFLNPKHDKHKEEINDKFKADNPLTGSLGAGKLVAGALEYNNYYLFSVTKFQDRMVSVGLFNFVIVRNLDLEQIKG